MKRNRRPHAPKLTEYEKIYARILYGEGMKQADISRVLGVSDSVITKLKKNDENWEDYRIPEITFSRLISLLSTHATRSTLKLISGDFEDESKAVQNIMRLASTMRNLHEQIDEIDKRDMILSLEKAVVWLAKKGRVEAADDVQKYLDQCRSEL